ncbi:MAG: thioether cross-link-forming SCIFF peptide maturase, partial [Clostridia bacterium]|nr:thioether cross-link-forming SCIFF peptide maturase [Clostridia bacterium]
MIHTFKQNGYNVVLDVASGSVHCVDEVAYDVINAYENTAREDIVREVSAKHGVSEQDVLDCLADVDELKAEGTLFSEDTFKPNVDILAKRDTVVKALCLHVAHTCNLN